MDGLDSLLQRANPTPQQGGGIGRPAIVRAIGRGETVLLSGHFERYVYALNEEAAFCVSERRPSVDRLPSEVRLRHARHVIDELGLTQWNNWAEKLKAYSAAEAGLWIDDRPVDRLVADRLWTWMKAPNCRALVRVFNMWGIPDIFTAITRSAVSRQRLWLHIAELVEKRNYIAQETSP
jgi:hypothetical protein